MLALANHPDALFMGFYRQFLVFEEPVPNREARSAQFENFRDNLDRVAKSARLQKPRTGIDHWDAGNGVVGEPVALYHAKGRAQHGGRRIVEKAEVIRIVDDARRIAVAELDRERHGVGEHGGSYFGCMRRAPSRRTTSPLR